MADFARTAVLFTTAMSVLFVVEYTVLAPWWRHPMGRGIVAFDVAILLALLPSALHYVLDLNLQHLFFAWYYVFSIGGAGLITVWRMVVLWRVQRADQRPEPDPSI